MTVPLVPAKVGTQEPGCVGLVQENCWIPAFRGNERMGSYSSAAV
jgi:hypothetical protein